MLIDILTQVYILGIHLFLRVAVLAVLRMIVFREYWNSWFLPKSAYIYNIKKFLRMYNKKAQDRIVKKDISASNNSCTNYLPL